MYYKTLIVSIVLNIKIGWKLFGLFLMTLKENI